MKYSFLGLIASLLLLVGCQSDVLFIRGKVVDSPEIDTLILSFDLENGKPNDTIIVKKGRFKYHDNVSNPSIAILYDLHRPERNVIFFYEPGLLDISFSSQLLKSRIKGTTLNNNWQEITDSITYYSMQINTLLEENFDKNTNSLTQSETSQNVVITKTKLKDYLLRERKKNASNPLGNYLDEIIKKADK